jgi:threonine dehydrogenase-like Zn-dependent dehydrogenase
MITHRFSILEAEKAFKMYEDHEDGILKVLLDVKHWD